LRATIARASRLRSNLTDAENYLWRHIRFRQISGHKFRRQRPIGPYIVDFVCLEQKLIIELDGGQHNENQASDVKRDTWLRSEGYEILRFWNDEVLTKLDGVKEVIFQSFNMPPPLSSPESGEE
jgi:very-short-patch-repair endonuclease